MCFKMLHAIYFTSILMPYVLLWVVFYILTHDILVYSSYNGPSQPAGEEGSNSNSPIASPPLGYLPE